MSATTITRPLRWNEENTVEHPVLAWLQTAELGWRFENQQQVIDHYRTDEVEVLLLPILRLKLKELNPEVITGDARADAILTLLRGERDNAEWFAWLRNEKTYKFSADEKAQPVRLIDYDDLGANDFLCTNQFWVDGGEHRIRTDVLLFVNGIPLVNIEAKTTARDWHVDWTEGAVQCGRYLREAPQLYHSNVFCVGVNEITLRYGVPGAKFHYWQTWRRPAPHHHVEEINELKCGIYGLCDRANLLDILRNFLVFEMEQGQRIKKVTALAAIRGGQRNRQAGRGTRQAARLAARPGLAYPRLRQEPDHAVRRPQDVVSPGPWAADHSYHRRSRAA